MCWSHVGPVRALNGTSHLKIAMDVTPKAQKRSRKGCTKKKKKLLLHEDTAGPSGKIHVPTEEVLSVENTPPRTNNQNSPQLSDDCKGAEWQYHGRFTESDVHVVWGSPQASPVLNTVKKGTESPLSPVSTYVLSKPRVNSEEPCELQFIAEILKLPEKIKAQKDITRCTETSVETKQSGSSDRVTSRAHESFSELFDEDMNNIIMKCSQEVEESIGVFHSSVGVGGNKPTVQQPENTGAVEGNGKTIGASGEPLTGSTCAPSSSRSCASSEKNTRKSPRVGNKNYVYSTSSVSKFYYRGRALGTSTSIHASGNVCQRKPSPRRPRRLLLDSHPREDKRESAVHPQRNTALDNSFTRVKEAFLEDDLDLMITVPDEVELDPASAVPAGDGELKSTAVAVPPPPHSSGLRGTARPKQPNLASGLDDSTFFEADVLQFLDSVENTVATTQPFRCTPEEIEKKRQEAKLKLSKKKKDEMERRRLEARLKLQSRKGVLCGKKL